MLPSEGFKTERLAVAGWGADLAEPEKRAALERELEGLLTPPVLEHLPPPLQLGEGGVAEWVRARDAEALMFRVDEYSTGRLIGLLIVAKGFDGSPPDVHFGYLLGEAAWGRGYATELVRGLVAACRSVRLIGGVGKENPASARVLEKAGFLVDAELSDGETDVFVQLIP